MIQESLEGLSPLRWVVEEARCVRYQGYQPMRFYRPGRLSSAPATNLYRPCGNHGRSKEERVAHLSLLFRKTDDAPAKNDANSSVTMFSPFKDGC